MLDDNNHGIELECPVCGRLFYCTSRSAWAYRRDTTNGIKIFCRWSCLRLFDKDQEEKNANKKKHFHGKRLA